MEKGRVRSTAESRSWPAGAGSSTAKCENKKKRKFKSVKCNQKKGKHSLNIKKVKMKYKNVKGSNRQGQQQKVNHARSSPAPPYMKKRQVKNVKV